MESVLVGRTVPTKPQWESPIRDHPVKTKQFFGKRSIELTKFKIGPLVNLVVVTTIKLIYTFLLVGTEVNHYSIGSKLKEGRIYSSKF